MAAAEVEAEGLWAAVVGEDRVVEGLRVGGAEGRVGGVGEGGFAVGVVCLLVTCMVGTYLLDVVGAWSYANVAMMLACP